MRSLEQLAHPFIDVLILWKEWASSFIVSDMYGVVVERSPMLAMDPTLTSGRDLG